MIRLNKSLKFGITFTILAASLSMTACGKRTSATQPQTTIPNGQNEAPIEIPLDSPNNNNNIINAAPSAVPNTKSGSFKVDKATFSSWQAKGIAVSNGTIFVTVTDTKGILQYGSIVKMSSSDGGNWKNIGTALLGLSHPIGKTVQGVAISGNTLIAVDSKSKVYTLDTANNKVKTLKTAGGTDVAAAGGTIYIANGSVNKTDSGVTAMSPIAGLSATGGIGGDSKGNVYAVSGSTIKKADPSGQVQDIITTNLAGAVDVAADNRNGDIYVLEASSIKRFNANGQMLSTFPSGAIKGVAIAIDEGGSLYVADSGNTNKDSQVIKFSAGN